MKKPDLDDILKQMGESEKKSNVYHIGDYKDGYVELKMPDGKVIKAKKFAFVAGDVEGESPKEILSGISGKFSLPDLAKYNGIIDETFAKIGTESMGEMLSKNPEEFFYMLGDILKQKKKK